MDSGFQSALGEDFNEESSDEESGGSIEV